MGLLKNLDKIFGDFADRTVAATVTETKFGKVLFRACKPDAEDPVIKAIETAAARAGLTLRLQFPGTWNIDSSVDITRVNAIMQDVSPGVFRITGFAQG